ncbi:MAG: hypothetical protein LBK61_00375 [Spirochaetaceae bacterium]|jgi:hypothetical protein|nr:hypothetical protein [Spirochaetaceae bacterium]
MSEKKAWRFYAVLAIMCAVWFAGCSEDVEDGDGGGDGGHNQEYPFDAGLYTSLYVSSDGDDEANTGEDEGAPLATLEKAYKMALKGDFKRIVVLNNLSVDGEDPVTLDPQSAGDAASLVIIEGRHYDLKIERGAGKNKSVIVIENGANITFKNIFINGIKNSAYHTALNIGGKNTKVTLEDGAKITGMKNGGNDPADADQGSGIRVHSEAQLVMEAGSSVVDCQVPTSVGNYCFGAVMVQSGAKFIMNGGSISGNRSTKGGGVYVYSENDKSSTFTLADGTISGNSADTDGGGVYVHSRSPFASNVKSVFTMTAGSISGNTAGITGGGVFSVAEKLKSNGGLGQAVEEEGRSELTMSGGEISDNDAMKSGGQGAGLKFQDTDFTMSGESKISGNKSNGNGGGIHVADRGHFNMQGGIISLNRTGASGGGVYFNGNNTKFTFYGSGVIYGKNDPDLGNITTTVGGGGAALYLPVSGCTLEPADTVTSVNTVSGTPQP